MKWRCMIWSIAVLQVVVFPVGRGQLRQVRCRHQHRHYRNSPVSCLLLPLHQVLQTCQHSRQQLHQLLYHHLSHLVCRQICQQLSRLTCPVQRLPQILLHHQRMFHRHHPQHHHRRNHHTHPLQSQHQRHLQRLLLHKFRPLPPQVFHQCLLLTIQVLLLLHRLHQSRVPVHLHHPVPHLVLRQLRCLVQPQVHLLQIIRA
mmetsp:Transcript_8419/g.12582  ORF Transcript_8419/g.12582 Transcript_8419/m.12582 type:complete len:201 (+) Transcript_8419:386-988(+)